MIERGKYGLAGEGGLTPGKKTVRITAVRKTGRQVAAGLPSDLETMVDEVEQHIPPTYNEKSTLTREVVAGNVNQHNFDLESEQRTTDRSTSFAGRPELSRRGPRGWRMLFVADHVPNPDEPEPYRVWLGV